MAAKPSGSLPTVFETFLELVRGIGPAFETQARRALEILCEKGKRAGKGFNPEVVAFHLNMLQILSSAKKSGWTPDSLRYGGNEMDRFTARQLVQIANRAQKLREDVRKLKLTNLVFEAHIGGRIPPGDLLSDPFPDDEVTFLSTLVDLPALAEWHGRTHLHPVDRRLWLVCEYVKTTTGGWNDALLVDILDPLKIQHTESVDALKEWRKRLRNR